MKSSYIISVIIAIIAFCCLYLGFDLNVFFSIAISIGIYFSFILILNKNEKNEEVDLDKIEYNQLYSQAVGTIKSIKNLETKIENPKIQEDISEICETSQKIVSSLKDRPQKIKQVRKFVDYYLPFTLKILYQYDTVEDQGLTSKESKDFMNRVEIMLDRVKSACNAQLNNMYDLDIIDTNADIKVFETMLKSDGLVDDNMNIIDVKKEGE